MGDGGLSTAGASARLHFCRPGSAGRARTLYFIAAAVLAALVPLILFAGLWVRALLNQSERDVQTYLGSRAATLSARLDAEIRRSSRSCAPSPPSRASMSRTSRPFSNRDPHGVRDPAMVDAGPDRSGQRAALAEYPRFTPGDLDRDSAAEVARQVAEQRQPKVVTRFGGSQGAVSGNSILLYLPAIPTTRFGTCSWRP